MVAKLEADAVHRARAGLLGRSADRSRGAGNDSRPRTCRCIAGNQGEALANESVGAAAPYYLLRGGQGLRDRWVGAGGRSADRGRLKRSDHQFVRSASSSDVALVYRSIITVVTVLAMVFLGLSAARVRGLPRLRPDRALDLRDQPSGDAGDRRPDRLRDLPRHGIEARTIGEDRSQPLHDVPRTAHVVLASE